MSPPRPSIYTPAQLDKMRECPSGPWRLDRMLETLDALTASRATLAARVEAMEGAIAVVRVNLSHHKDCSHMTCDPTCAHAILDAALAKGGE